MVGGVFCRDRGQQPPEGCGVRGVGTAGSPLSVPTRDGCPRGAAWGRGGAAGTVPGALRRWSGPEGTGRGRGRTMGQTRGRSTSPQGHLDPPPCPEPEGDGDIPVHSPGAGGGFSPLSPLNRRGSRDVVAPRESLARIPPSPLIAVVQ